MTVTAPPRPPRPSDPVTHDEFDALVEALIEEARQRGRRRRRRRGAIAILVALVGASLFAVLDRTVLSGNGSSVLAEQSALAATTPPKIAFTQSGFGGQTNGWLYVVNPDGSGKRRLARTGGTPSWSPDGRTLLLGNLVVNADGSGSQALPGGGGHASWSPDGRRIAFVRYSGCCGNSRLDIYVMNADGSGERKLTNGGGGHPVWSPDGQKIAFPSRGRLSSGAWSRKFAIYVMNADGSGRRHLAAASYNSDPVWSPDGRQIAYVRGYDIWVMNADGTQQRRLTSGSGRDVSPSWSPDGQKIAFDRRLGKRGGRRGTDWGRASNFDVYVMNANGSGQRRLARNGSEPRWSPNGQKIAFSRALGNGPGLITTRDNWEIFVMNADGTQQHNVSRKRLWDDCCVAWSP